MTEQCKQPEIDFVIAWVDGNDTAWRKEKQRYAAQELGSKAIVDDGEYRYRDWDLLRYWFRAVEKFAPWVRKIHFLTCGQIPEWLNTEHPKLHIVNHKDYIPNEYLPTFNSHTIELNMHRIDDLAEHFVYFNDDMYVARPVSPDDFFHDGFPRDVFALDAIYCAPGSAGSYNCSDLEIINANFNKQDQFQKHYRKWFRLCYGKNNLYRTLVLLPWRWFPGFYYQHLPSNFLKSTLKKVWAVAGDTLDETCRHKFRGKAQVNQWVFKFWQLAEGTFVPQSARSSRCYHIKDQSVDDLCNSIQSERYALLCINDTDRTTEFEKKKAQIAAAFDVILGQSSAFER